MGSFALNQSHPSDTPPRFCYSKGGLHHQSLHHMNYPTLGAAVVAAAVLLTGCGSSEPKSKNLDGNEVGQELMMGRTGCERTLKGLLRDPGSLERGEYVITEASPTSWAASMRFGARNGFGGMNQMAAVCSFDGTQYTVQLTEGQ